jgi:hypothetical protein
MRTIRGRSRGHECHETRTIVAETSVFRRSLKNVEKLCLISTGHWDLGSCRLASSCHQYSRLWLNVERKPQAIPENVLTFLYLVNSKYAVNAFASLLTYQMEDCTELLSVNMNLFHQLEIEEGNMAVISDLLMSSCCQSGIT